MIPSRLGPTRNAMSSDFCCETEAVGSLMKAVRASKVNSCVLFCVACLSSSKIDVVFLFSGVVKIVGLVALIAYALLLFVSCFVEHCRNFGSERFIVCV